VRLLDRLFAIALSLVLIGGNAAVCAGWAATPEARMACCTGTDDGCPMHQGGSHHTGSARPLTQAQADSCCAASERDQSNKPTPTSAAAISSAVLGAGIVVPATLPTLILSDRWRTDRPIPITPVPRHVLLSVFLV